MSYTMEDFKRDYFKEHFPKLTLEERREVLQSLPAEDLREALQSLPPEARLAGLSPDALPDDLSGKDASVGLRPRPVERVELVPFRHGDGGGRGGCDSAAPRHRCSRKPVIAGVAPLDRRPALES